MPDDVREVRDLAGASASVVDPKTLNLHQRLHAAMLEVKYVQKDRAIGTYKVVTHDAVTAAVRPALVKHRVAYYPQNMVYVQNGNRTEMTVDIHFVNIDDRTDFIAVPSLGYGIDASDKGPGKALSYAVKMALLKALGLETGEDADDGTNTEHVPEPPKSPPGITAARKEVDEALRHVDACSDGDSLIGLLDAIETIAGKKTAPMKVLALKICRDFPGLWIGPEQFSGFKGRIEKAGNELLVAPEVGNWVRKVEEAARKETP